MADTKKCVSILNDGNDDYEIKDAEARAAIQGLVPPEYASVATCESIIDELT